MKFSKFALKLPVGRSNAQAEERKKMFEAIDQSGNGHLSLAELELGLQTLVGEELSLMEPAIKMAYKVSRAFDPSDNELEAAFIEFDEFRIFLVNVRRYIELYAAFEDIDEGDDHRIDFSEFSAGLELLDHWGIQVVDP